MTPTSRTTTALRAHEIEYEIVEHWKSFPRKAEPGRVSDLVRKVMDKKFDPELLRQQNFGITCDQIAAILPTLGGIYNDLVGNGENKVRQDLSGFIDVLALTDDYTVGLQVTSGTNLSARVAKLREPKIEPKVRAWISKHRRLLLLGWRELTTPVPHWAPRVLEVTIEWDEDPAHDGLTKMVAREQSCWGTPQPTVRGVQEWIAEIVKGGGA